MILQVQYVSGENGRGYGLILTFTEVEGKDGLIFCFPCFHVPIRRHRELSSPGICGVPERRLKQNILPHPSSATVKTF